MCAKPLEFQLFSQHNGRVLSAFTKQVSNGCLRELFQTWDRGKGKPQRWSSRGFLIHCNSLGMLRSLRHPSMKCSRRERTSLKRRPTEGKLHCFGTHQIIHLLQKVFQINVGCQTWWPDIKSKWMSKRAIHVVSFCYGLREKRGWHTHNPAWKFMKNHFNPPTSAPRPVQVVKEPSWHWPGRDAPRPPSMWLGM